MVSIIERSSFVAELRKNPKFDLFFSLIFNINSDIDFTIDAEIDRIFLNALYALKENNKNKFIDNYSEISLREPKKNSPFTNDNLLLFILITGVIKFNIDLTWIKKIIKVRENSDKEGNLIDVTFRNIITNNYQSKDNTFQIIIVLEDLMGLEYISWEEKQQFYKQIISSDFPFFRSDFLNIISLRAFDLMLLQGDKSKNSLFSFLKDFEKRFTKRILFISKLTYAFLCLIIIAIIAFLVWSPNYVGIMGKFDTFFGILGIGILSIFTRKNIIDVLYKSLCRLLGYKSKNKEKDE